MVNSTERDESIEAENQAVESQTRREKPRKIGFQHTLLMSRLLRLEHHLLQPHRGTAAHHTRNVQRLGQDIRRHVLSAHKMRRKESSLYLIPEPKEAQVQVLHPPMVLRVLGHADSALVVHVEHRGTVQSVAKLREQIAHPHRLTACVDSRYVLRLGRGLSNKRLKARGPADGATANSEEVAACGTAGVDGIAMGSVRERAEDVLGVELVTPVHQAQVLSALEVAEEVLDRLPVRTAGIGNETRQERDGISDIRPCAALLRTTQYPLFFSFSFLFLHVTRDS